MSKERILFIGGNFSPEQIGIGKYNGEMVDWLVKKGHDCTVITSYPYYPEWKVQDSYSDRWYWFKKEKRVVDEAHSVNIYRCPQYTPVNPSGVKRMLLDLTFTISAIFIVLKLLFSKRHDCVISVVPSFQVGLVAILYKKLTGAKFLYHIQDLQIDAARDIGMIKSERLINVLLYIERYILKKADVISTISDGMIKKVVEKCTKEVAFFPNWVDTDLYFPLSVDNSQLKPLFNLKESDKVVLYSGAIGQKQGLDIILDTANVLRNISNLKFVICGTGPYKITLEEKAKELNLTNLIFMPLQPADKFNQFLNMADAHLVIQKANASDLVMPSKLSTILSIGGLAVVTAPEHSSLHNVLTNHKMGIISEPEKFELLADAIKDALYTNNEHIKNNARVYANKFLLKEKILSNYSMHFKKKQKESTKTYPINLGRA